MRILSAIFAVIVVIVLMFSIVMAAPEKGADCYDERLKVSVRRGEVAHPKGECLRLACSDKGALRVEPCEFGIPPGCHVVDGDLSKQYPACCPTLKCDKL